jgi:protein-tyrosine phosphatase
MQRRLFLLTPVLCLGRDAERHIKLEGAQNFRDIGGYPTTDGKRIRYGRVFRADALHKLTAADYEKLAALRIQTVCDFRAKTEREREKTQWAGVNAPEMMVLDIMAADPARASEDPNRSFMARLMAPGAGADAADKIMSEGMRSMALTAAPLYGKMIRRILDSKQPLLYHCTAGKDRTGMGTALLMRTLGATDEAIYDDYLLVNKLVPMQENSQNMERMKALVGQGIPMEALKSLGGTKREWLASGFQAIDEKYGSFDRYRREALGLSDQDQKRLRRWMLQ